MRLQMTVIFVAGLPLAFYAQFAAAFQRPSDPTTSLHQASPTPLILAPAPSEPVPSRSTGTNSSINELLYLDEDFDRQLAEPQYRELTEAWWTSIVGVSLRRQIPSVPVTLDDLLIRTLQHSQQIKVFAEMPLIRETAITEADAAFDWNAYLDSRWDDTSDPVGNSLTAGPGINRFRDHQLGVTGGVRRRTRTGGQVELGQRFGLQNNNSTFFLPNNQGTARLTLNYTQPLLRGRGRVYNESLTCLARIDRHIADDEFRRQLESHLLEVARGYWALYLERSTYLQRLKLYARARELTLRLTQRREIDATQTQIASAEAALAERKADLVRAKTAIQNAESRLRSLVNDPELGGFADVEILPMDRPNYATISVDMNASMGEAIRNRPEIDQALKQIKAASIRVNMSRHELLPVLNLVTEAYLAGLDDRNNLSGAFGNQFDQGEPGYSIGLNFEVPLHNRAAKARYQRRRHELRQINGQYAMALDTVRLEVEVAVREISTSQHELLSKEQAMLARLAQLDQLKKRWKLLPGEDASASLTLENLLRAQEQLAATENEYLRAQMTYNLSLTNLKKAMGTLMTWGGVQIGITNQNGLPTYSASASPVSASPISVTAEAQQIHTTVLPK